jgi:DNA-directed RNA polymerase subunit beta'
VIIREENRKTKEYVELPLFLPTAEQVRRLPDRRGGRPRLCVRKPGKTVVASKGEIAVPRLRQIVEELGDEIAEDFVPVRSVLKQGRDGRAASAMGTFSQRASCPRSATRSGSSPRSRSASLARSRRCGRSHRRRRWPDITHGLPRVVEIFEARNPKGAATLAEVTGTVASRRPNASYGSRSSPTPGTRRRFLDPRPAPDAAHCRAGRARRGG